MLPNKIEITKEICNIIKAKREEQHISSRDLSMNFLGKSQGYISSLENGRVKYLKRKDIIKLFEVLYNIDENSAVNKLQDILIASPSKISNKLSENNDFGINIHASHNVNTDESYKTIEDPTDKISFKDLIDNINLGFETIYKKKPDFTISTLKRFVVSLHFDLSFMMVILHTPFFIFKGLSHDERQAFLSEMAESFNKYAIISKEHLEEQKKSKSDSTNNEDDEDDNTSSTDNSEEFSKASGSPIPSDDSEENSSDHQE